MAETSTGRVRVRPWIRRLGRILLPVLLLIGAGQVWDNFEARRVEPLLARITAARKPMPTLPPAADDGWSVFPWERSNNAERLYRAAAMASKRRTWQPTAGDPLLIRREAMSRGALPPAAVLDEGALVVAGNEWSLRLVEHAAGLPVQLPRSARSDSSLGEVLAVGIAAAHHTLDHAQQRNADAAVEWLIVRARTLRMFQPDQWAWGANLATQEIRGVAADVAIVVGWTSPSDAQLQRLDAALGEMVPREYLRWTLAEMALFRRDLLRRRVFQGPASFPAMSPIRANNLHALLTTMNRAVDATELPWPERIKVLEQLTVARPLLPVGPSGFWDVGRLVRDAATWAAESEAFLRAARIAVAIERYRRTHGEAPGTLAMLSVRDDLTDPFTGEAMRYTRSGGGYAVYSVGRNRRDDGGASSGEDGKAQMPGRGRPLDDGVSVTFAAPPR